MSNYDWDAVMQKATDVSQQHSHWTYLAKDLNIPRKTLTEGLKREFGIDSIEDLRKRRSTPAAPTVKEMKGLTLTEQAIDPKTAYEKACTVWENTETVINLRQNQVLSFDRGPVAIAFFGDLHLGGSGVNYPRIKQEVELAVNTPGMYIGLVGDVVDNYIIGNLMRYQMGMSITIGEQWALARYILELVAPKTRLIVSGNHDNWTKKLTGIDYMRDIAQVLVENSLYDDQEIKVQIDVEGWRVPTKIRHKWNGYSQWNITHAIEKAARFDGDFVLGVGGHTHASGATREMNAQGENGLAVLVGTYKEEDEYARERGFPRHNTSAAATVIFDPNERCMVGYGNIYAAAKYMNMFYGQ